MHKNVIQVNPDPPSVGGGAARAGKPDYQTPYPASIFTLHKRPMTSSCKNGGEETVWLHEIREWCVHSMDLFAQVI